MAETIPSPLVTSGPATHSEALPGPTTPDAFMADRMAFWDRFTGFTLKTTVAIFIFCAWLWWCAIAGFSILHIVSLPIAVGIAMMVL